MLGRQFLHRLGGKIQSHFATQKSAGMCNFVVDFSLVPLQIFSHDVDDSFQNFVGIVSVQEGDAKSPGNYVNGSASIFAFDGIDDFTVDVWMVGMNSVSNQRILKEG